ncbi:MAG TPA: hypothetical protein VE111_21690 [Bradyrhizobium sp.]|nr:hypothetical protein [Bradyrhizobium sp.]
MKRLSIMTLAVAAALFAANPASTQIIPPGGSRFNPPLPAPPPSPKIEVPVVPQMDAPPHQSYVPAPGPSFSDRITTCLSEGAAGGLGPGEREAYSRTCANR